MSKVTIFKDFKDVSNPRYTTVSDALDRIKKGGRGGSVKGIVEKIRNPDDTTEVDELKKSLPCILFGGVADKAVKDKWDRDSYRMDESVTQHSGCFVLDFDNVTNPTQKKQQLANDPYILAAFLSPSMGVKALVKCPPSLDNHGLYYNAILSRYPELDPSSKNISRLCFASYDPDIYINWDCLTWDKTITDEEYKDQKTKRENHKKKRVLDIAINLMRKAKKGERHNTIIRAANLCGGYDRLFKGDEAIQVLNLEVKNMGFTPAEIETDGYQAVRDGYNYGKTMPIEDLKDIEKESDFTRRADGTYDFLADEHEMREYETAVIQGTLEMGLPTGMKGLNPFWMFKKGTVVWFAGRDNTGKSFVLWYLAVVAAMLHGWKFILYSKENNDGQVRKKIKEFFIGKSIKLMSADELSLAETFVKDHFIIFTAKKMHTATDFLSKCEMLIDEGFEADIVIGEPYNGFDVPENANEYALNRRVLNLLQTFKENYCGVWVADHISTQSARGRNSGKGEDGKMTVPTKHDVEYGQMKPNKVDDFIIVHRDIKSGDKYTTEIHVDKIKDTETGGQPTPKDCPVLLTANRDLCGFSCGGQDPVKEYWIQRGRKPEPAFRSEASQRLGSWESNSQDTEPSPF